MIIKKARIDWMKGWANTPELRVTVDRMPRMDNVRFKTFQDGRSTTYWACDGDFVTFFTHVPGNQTGYGGAMFRGQLEDGTIFNVKGPWSDNALAVNGDFPPSHNVAYYQEEDEFPEMGFAAHLKMSTALRLIKECDADYKFIKHYGGPDSVVTDEELIKSLEDKISKNEIIGNYDIVIVMKGMTLAESQEAKNKDGKD